MRHFAFLVVFVFLLLTGGLAVSAEVDAGPPDLDELLPQNEDYMWSYWGFAEYGHEMEITSILKGEEKTHYSVEGEVYDLSGGESNLNYDLSISYLVNSEVLTQEKEEEMMLDSNFDEIELIRAPLEEGTTWTQVVTDENGNEVTLVSEITNVEMDESRHVYTVRYEDADSPYYEERQIKENVGVVFFEKLMIDEADDIDNYPVTYQINEGYYGVQAEREFTDTDPEDWFMEYVPALTSLEILHGYPDGTFRSGDKVTVAEFLKLILHSTSYKAENGDDFWYSPYVDTAIALGIIEEGEFKDYNRPITREEMVKVMVLALEEKPESTGDLSFEDAAVIGEEYRGYVQTATDFGILAGYTDNTFRPQNPTSRGEAAKLFYYTLMLLEEEEFTSADAFALEEEFDARLFPETDGQRVTDFDTKEALVEHLAVVTDWELAEELVDGFYYEEDGALYVAATEKPAMLLQDQSYQLYKQNEHAYYLVQEAETELYGTYRITVMYEYVEKNWIISDRQFGEQGM